jgi:hypothetical protein
VVLRMTAMNLVGKPTFDLKNRQGGVAMIAD